MPVQLVGLTEGLKIVIDKPILLLGRDPECDIQYDSRKISRRHCCVARVGDQLVVRDLGSTNGIRINGIRVVEGLLSEGDELTVGNHRYIVRWDALPSEPTRSQANRVSGASEPAPHRSESQAPDGLLEASEEPIPFADDPVNDTPTAVSTPSRGDRLPNSRNEAAGKNDLPKTPGDSSIPGLSTSNLSLAPISEDLPTYSPRNPSSKDPDTRSE
jgi:predicted component of type VI protein secretion system